jgi:hypothetical protein
MNSYAIVFTTINMPAVLESYERNLEQYGNKDNVLFVIVGDKKSPKETGEFCIKYQEQGLQIVYLDPEAQCGLTYDKIFNGAFRNVVSMLPWNSDVRRNIGYLYAARLGADTIISIDDDNFALAGEDFLAGHSIVGTIPGDTTVRSANGWFNVCQLLETNRPGDIYPRGYPVSKMHNDSFEWDAQNDRVVVANSGLWTHAPDVDAMTNLVLAPLSSGLAFPGQRTILAPGQRCPLNSQNTSFARRALPAMFFWPQRFMYNGMQVDRYGDIWMGFVMHRAALHMNEAVSYGAPVVAHIRNSHNYLRDLQCEVGGMALNEHIAQWIDEAELPLRCDTYSGVCAHVMDAVCWHGAKEYPECASYFGRLKQQHDWWIEACDKVQE